MSSQLRARRNSNAKTKKKVSQKPIRMLAPGESRPPNYLGSKLNRAGKECTVNFQGHDERKCKCDKDLNRLMCVPPRHKKLVPAGAVPCHHCYLPGCIMKVHRKEFDEMVEQRRRELLADDQNDSLNRKEFVSLQNTENKKLLKDLVASVFSKKYASHKEFCLPSCGVEYVDGIWPSALDSVRGLLVQQIHFLR